MIRRPPKYTRTYTLFPDATRFRSWIDEDEFARALSNKMRRQTADNAKAGQGNDLSHADRGLMDRPQSDCAHVHETSAHRVDIARQLHAEDGWRSEEHTSELQSLMRISYAAFCLKKKNIYTHL